jgi:rhodanese-related sulfurtransferase
MKEKTAAEFKEMRESGTTMHVIDVREPQEYEAGHLEAELMPLGELMQRADTIPRDRPVVVYCRSGARSAAAIFQLEKKFGLDNLYNLKGGLMAYAEAYDPGLMGL